MKDMWSYCRRRLIYLIDQAAQTLADLSRLDEKRRREVLDLENEKAKETPEVKPQTYREFVVRLGQKIADSPARAHCLDLLERHLAELNVDGSDPVGMDLSPAASFDKPILRLTRIAAESKARLLFDDLVPAAEGKTRAAVARTVEKEFKNFVSTLLAALIETAMKSVRHTFSGYHVDVVERAFEDAVLSLWKIFTDVGRTAIY